MNVFEVIQSADFVHSRYKNNINPRHSVWTHLPASCNHYKTHRGIERLATSSFDGISLAKEVVLCLTNFTFAEQAPNLPIHSCAAWGESGAEKLPNYFCHDRGMNPEPNDYKFSSTTTASPIILYHKNAKMSSSLSQLLFNYQILQCN